MGPTNNGETCVCTLSTRSAVVNDSGEWRCELINDFGTSTTKCAVRVIDAGDIDKEVAPTLEEHIENTVVTENSAFKFRCKAVGRPEPEVKWFRNGIPVDASGFGSDARFCITSGAGGVETLEVRRAKMRDGGIYKCKVMNSAGWAACDAMLLVQENPDDDYIPYTGGSFDYSLADKIKARRAADRDLPNDADLLVSQICDSPTIRKFIMKWSLDDDQTLGFPVHLSSKCAVAGVSVVLGCLVKGKPPLRIRWYKENKELFEDGKHFIRKRGGFLSLEIPCAQEEDTGNYTCEVRNDQGKIFTSCYLQVEPVWEITDEVPTKPIFVKPMKRLTVNEGEIIRFRVAVKAYPAAGFKWFKDAQELHDTERITSEVMPNGIAQLIIENANVRDIGLYACEAHNFAGRTRNMVRISVRDKWEADAWRARSVSSTDVNTSRTSVSQDKTTPASDLPAIDYEASNRCGVFAYEPMFTKKLPTNLTIEDKGQFLLECCCNGNPKPTVSWYKDSKPVEKTDRHRFLSLGDWYGLEITEARPDDAGIYTAIIENSAGEGLTSCTVEMKFFKCDADDIPDPVESTGEISDRIAGIAAIQSTHAVEIFKAEMYGLPQIVPSCNLCNTERDWSERLDREIEVIEAIESPSFTQTLPDRITPLVKEKNVRLTCRVAGKPCPKVEWFKDDKVIEDSDTNIVKEWDFNERLAGLFFKTITASMSGKYSCLAYSDFGGHASSIVEIDVKGTDDTDSTPDNKPEQQSDASAPKTVPGFTVKLEDKEIKPGSDLKLEVKAAGFPAPEIKWYKNDQEIKTDEAKYKITNAAGGLHTLMISKVHLSDSDCYKCEAINECGAVSTCAHVVVQEDFAVATGKGSTPTFSEPLHSVTAIAGNDAVFKCTAKGVPRPKLTWVKDGKILSRDTDKVKILTQGMTTSLTVLSAAPSDAGVFLCVAENEHGLVKSSANLKVNTSGDKGKNLTNGNAKTGQTGGSTTKDITASQGSKSDATGKTGSVKSSLSSETGNTDNSTAGQEGSVSSIPLSNGDLDNKYKRMPKFIVRPFSKWLVSKEPLEIECQVVKSEGMQVKWYHNGREITQGRFIMEVKPAQG